MKRKENLKKKFFIMRKNFLIQEGRFSRHLKMVFFHCLKKICIKNRLKKKKKKKKEETIPDWVKGGNHTYERITEKVNNYKNNRWYSKVGKKSITMHPANIFLQDIVSGKFNNAKEANKMSLDNVYGDEEKIRRSDNRTDHNKDMIEVYDQVRKNFITLSPIPDIDYVPTYNKSDEYEEDYDI